MKKRGMYLVILITSILMILISVGFASAICTDGDLDGYGVCPNCDIINGCTFDGNDCDDGNIAINPGAAEVCNDLTNTDDDCDGNANCLDSDCFGIAGPGDDWCCSVDADCAGDDDYDELCNTPTCAANLCTYPLIVDNTQDIVGAQLCDGFCQACQAGACGNANAATDPGNDCPVVACDMDSCDGAGACQDDTAAEGYLCTDDCTYCNSGSCDNRLQCDATECAADSYCDSLGGNCLDADDNSQQGEDVCEACVVSGQHNFGEAWVFEAGTPNCCNNNAGENYVANGVGAPMCCDLGTENCVDGNGTCRDEFPAEATCNDGIDNDCDNLIDCADPDCLTISSKNQVPACVFETDNITLYATVGGNCIISVFFEITFPGLGPQNFTGLPSSNPLGNYKYTINSISLTPSTNVQWTVYASNCCNATIKDGTMNFYVNSRTNLTVNPVAPDGLNNWYVTEPLFTLANPDLGANNLYYRWDSAQKYLYTAPFGLENIPNQPSSSAGTLELNYWSDICSATNENETEQTQIFYIDLTGPMFTDFIPANNTNVVNDPRPQIRVYIDEKWQSNSGINLSSVQMTLDSNPVTPTVSVADGIDALASYIPTSDLANGWHTVTISATDNSGRTNQTVWIFNITQEATTLSMQVNSPADGYYGTRKLLMDVSSDRTVAYLTYIDWISRRPSWRILCRDCSGYSREKTFTDGVHNLTIRSTDSRGVSQEVNISFFVDSRDPRVSRTLPRRMQITNGNNFYIKYIEDNLQEIKLNYGNDIVGFREKIMANCSSGRNQECSTNVDLTDYDSQDIIFYFDVTDVIRTISSSSTMVEVDTTPPILTVNEPESDERYGKAVPFNIEISETVNRLEYYDSDSSSPRWIRICSRCNEYGATRTRQRYFREKGTHIVQIKATDYAGNTDLETVQFTVY